MLLRSLAFLVGCSFAPHDTQASCSLRDKCDFYSSQTAFCRSPLVSESGKIDGCCKRDTFCPATASQSLETGDASENTTLDEVINRTETIVRDLVSASSDLLRDLCKYEDGCACSCFACTNNTGDPDCSTLTCSSDLSGCCGGRRINERKSTVHYLPNTDIDEPDENYRATLCATTLLDRHFVSAWQSKRKSHAWQYFGSVNGMFRFFPGHPFCGNYDPRLRPWYTVASGPKDVLIVVDTSGSINDNSRPEIVQRTLSELIDSLGPRDRLGLVKFDEQATVFTPNDSGGTDNHKFLQTTLKGKVLAKNAIRDLTKISRSDFASALKEALNYMKRARDSGSSTLCSSVLLFITDGRDSMIEDGTKTKGQLLAEVQSYYDQLSDKYPQPNLFSLSVGSEADNSVPAMLSCHFKGVWSSVEDGDDPMTRMRAFFDFLALSLREQDEVLWTEVYEDALGVGNVSTASAPVFDEHGAFIGVVGVDIMISALDGVATEKQMMDAIKARPYKCSFLVDNVTCDLQITRRQSAASIECPELMFGSEVCIETSNFVFVSPKNELVKLDRENAAEACARDYGGRLAHANSLKELAVLASLSAPDGSWISLSYNKTEEGFSFDGDVSSIFENADGSTCDLTKSQYIESPYRCKVLWAHGEPNNYTRDNDSGEECVFIDRRGTSSNLNDQSCDERHHYVCAVPRAEARCTLSGDFQGLPPPTLLPTEDNENPVVNEEWGEDNLVVLVVVPCVLGIAAVMVAAFVRHARIRRRKQELTALEQGPLSSDVCSLKPIPPPADAFVLRYDSPEVSGSI